MITVIRTQGYSLQGEEPAASLETQDVKQYGILAHWRQGHGEEDIGLGV